MLTPVKARNAVALGIGIHQDHRAMETKTISPAACLLVGFALLCGLQNIQGFPSVDPPLLPAGLRRSADPSSIEYDDMLDAPQGPPAPPEPAVSPVGPSLNPLLPLIRLKPGKLGPVVDPTQFIQMKADFLKNLFGPGGAKSPVARAASSGPTKWAGGAAWASGPGGPAAEKWGPPSKGKPSKAPKPTPSPAQPNPWDWPAPAAPQAPVGPQASSPWAPAPAPWAPAAPAPAPIQVYPAPVSSFPSVPGYWIPTGVIPAPTEPVDKKSVLLDALLDQILAQPTQSPPLRFARAPVADPASPTPSPYLTDLLNSLNLTRPDVPPTLKPTIEPPGFWFPSYVPAAPGSLTPFAVDTSAQIAKKTKFLSDLFASKAAAAATPPSLAAKGVDPSEYSTKVSAYLNDLLDSTTTTSKRAAGIAPKKSKAAKPSKGAKPIKVVTPSPAAVPTNPPVIEEIPEDEVVLNQILGLRKKREIEDETDPEVPATPEDEMAPDTTPEADAAAEKAKASAAILNDMAVVKQNILIQLDAMSKAESAASKATKAAAKAAKKASSLATLLNLPVPTPAPVSTAVITDLQQKIALLTNIYSNLSDTQKNITAAPDAKDPLNPDKLFIAAVNAKVNKILVKSALLPPAPKVARSNNSNWQRWRDRYAGQQDTETATQYEADSETSRRQKSAVPLVAAVFAPQTHHYQGRQPYWWN